jgi:hypothetical protein
MKRFSFSAIAQRHSILLIVLFFGLLLAACGAAGTSSTGQASTIPPSEELYVLDGVSGGAQRIIAFHPGGPALFTLPVGLVSPDHRMLYTTTTSGGSTTLRVLDMASGATLRSLTLPGAFSITGVGFADAVLSGDGRWLALRASSGVSSATTIVLVDTQAGVLAKTIRLAGSFELDALAPGGAMLYLIQNTGDAEPHYYVRAYDVAAGQLLNGIIVDKTEVADPLMVGAALARQMAPDGALAYTLYVNTATNIAFIHMLPLASTANGPLLARCVDLPNGRSAELLGSYTLTLSADGTTLYAVNAALGLASGITVHPDGPFGDNIDISATFYPALPSATTTQQRPPAAVLAHDQRTLYVAGPQGIWAFTAATLKLQRVYLSDQSFTGLAGGRRDDPLCRLAHQRHHAARPGLRPAADDAAQSGPKPTEYRLDARLRHCWPRRRRYRCLCVVSLAHHVRPTMRSAREGGSGDVAPIPTDTYRVRCRRYSGIAHPRSRRVRRARGRARGRAQARGRRAERRPPLAGWRCRERPDADDPPIVAASTGTAACDDAGCDLARAHPDPGQHLKRPGHGDEPALSTRAEA